MRRWIHADTHGLLILAIQRHTMVLGADEQQMPIGFDAGTHRITVAWLDLGRVVLKFER